MNARYLLARPLECQAPMPRKPTADINLMLPFARWLTQHKDRRGVSMQRIADEADMNVSQLHKIVKSYLPQYSGYPRPGVEKTIMIGRFFGDAGEAAQLLACKPRAVGRYVRPVRPGVYRRSDVLAHIAGLRQM